jgi:hypothetical protein
MMLARRQGGWLLLFEAIRQPFTATSGQRRTIINLRL